jgi:hypothetical protein
VLEERKNPPILPDGHSSPLRDFHIHSLFSSPIADIMTTLNDVLATQKKHQLLAAPSQKPPAAGTNGTTTFNLYNSTTSSTVYAYVTGLETNNNSATYLLEADGVTPCTYPENN